jgi:hypothetical protein
MERKRIREKGRKPMITASEIGTFVYCARAWHLQRGGEEVRDEFVGPGDAFHKNYGAGISFARLLDRIGKAIGVTALILLAILGIYFLLLWNRIIA